MNMWWDVSYIRVKGGMGCDVFVTGMNTEDNHTWILIIKDMLYMGWRSIEWYDKNSQNKVWYFYHNYNDTCREGDNIWLGNEKNKQHWTGFRPINT